MASPTQWTWVWVDSRSWWWTGRPDVLRFMGSQRVGHNWLTELNWCQLKNITRLYLTGVFFINFAWYLGSILNLNFHILFQHIIFCYLFSLHFFHLLCSIYLESLLYVYRNPGFILQVTIYLCPYLIISFHQILRKKLGACLSSSLIIYFAVNYNKSAVQNFLCIFICHLMGSLIVLK